MEKHLHKLFYELEDHHWWSIGIRRIQLHFVRKYLSVLNPTILDIGCGPGATLNELSKIGKTVGIDVSKYVLQLARSRGIKNVRYGNATKLSFANNSFNCVTAFDMLEHVKNDDTALQEIYRVLKTKGVVVLTSPAFMWLYDDHDRLNHHYRRYSRSELLKKAYRVGFKIRYISYCNSFLFPLIVGVKYYNRLVKRQGKFNNEDTPEPLNSILKFIFSSEIYFLDAVRFPFGLSILAVLEKVVREG
jgi:ubiquinone/menaquinone biosynthesis C-methylase UbiE